MSYTTVWITCKNAQLAADEVMHRLMASEWTVGAASKKTGVVWGENSRCLQVAGLHLDGAPKNGSSKFVDWIVSILRGTRIEDFSVIVKVDGRDGTSTSWNVGQGTAPVSPSELGDKIKPEPEKAKTETQESNNQVVKVTTVFDKIMGGEEDDEEDEDISCKLNLNELKIVQRVMASSVKLSEVFFTDDMKTRQKTLKAINKIVDNAQSN